MGGHGGESGYLQGVWRHNGTGSWISLRVQGDTQTVVRREWNAGMGAGKGRLPDCSCAQVQEELHLAVSSLPHPFAAGAL